LEVHVEFSSGIPLRSTGPTPALRAETKQDFEMVAVLMGEKGTPSSLQGLWQGVRLSCRALCRDLWIDRRLAQPPPGVWPFFLSAKGA
jgi:hypothetical protein